MAGKRIVLSVAVAVVAWSLLATSCKRTTNQPAGLVPIPSRRVASFSHIESSQVVKVARFYPKQQAAVQQVPMSLTTSDGTGLKLVSLEARAVVQGPLAFTELQLSFHNPEDRVREGRFAITLPPGAAVSRFAMKLGDRWQEAEVVERQAARRIYEDFLHRKQDPALLEKKAGNQFRARIFPIPARADKELKLSYSQELASLKTPYSLPLKGLPKMGSLKITAFVGERVEGQAATSMGGVSVSNKIVRVDKQDYAPDRDFEVKTQSSIEGLHHETLALARVTPEISSAKLAIKSMLVLVDTSASRAAGFQRQVEQLGALLHHLKGIHGKGVRIQLACFDQEVGSIFEGTLGELSQEHLNEILTRRPLGASDLHRALGAAARTKGYQRLLLVTDGIATAGKTEGADLRAVVKDKLSKAVKRLDVVLVGGIRDEEGMRTLVTGTLEQDGLVLDGAAASAELARKLSRRTVSGITVSVPGAKWIWPDRLDGVQPGDAALVFADLPAGALPKGEPLTVKLGGKISQTHEIKLESVERPLLERAWVKARIARLQRQRDAAGDNPDLKTAVRKQIIELSIKHRVLSDFTALLVLETEYDYQRYNIQRTALADILVVGASGLEVLRRTDMVLRDQQQPETDDEGGAPTDKADAPSRRGRLARRAARTGVLKLLGARGKGGGATGGDADGNLGGGAPGVGQPPPEPAPSPAAPAAEAPEPEAKADRSFEGVGGLSAAGPPRGGLRARPRPRIARPVKKTPSTAVQERVPTAVVTVVNRQLQGFGGQEAAVTRVVRRGAVALRACYGRALKRSPAIAGRLVLEITVSKAGHVTAVEVKNDTVRDTLLRDCVKGYARRWRFPPPPADGATVKLTLDFRAAQAVPTEHADEDEPSGPPALSGKLAAIHNQLKLGNVERALVDALRWRAEQPGDVLALLGLGEALERRGSTVLAARVYGSIIDLFPSRADLRRFAGNRLEALGKVGLALAADTYAQAVQQRPDHGSSHRGLAYALVRLGKHEQALAALEAALTREHRRHRSGVERILREDMGLVAAALVARSSKRRDEIKARIAKHSVLLPEQPSLRFVLTWETDANDVDFHIHDGQGGHAYYSRMSLPSGGSLYADVRNGYGPECFAIEGKPSAYPYRLQIHYYSRGPMGYGMGKLQVLQHDGSGELKFEDRPFVVMNDRAYVNLGVVKGPL